MVRPKMPASCQKTVAITEVAKLQEFSDRKLVKGGKKHKAGDIVKIPRFLVRITSDGKSAVMTDTKHPDYIKRQEEVNAIKQEKRAVISAQKKELRARIKEEKIKARDALKDKNKEIKSLKNTKKQQKLMEQKIKYEAKLAKVNKEIV